jgi:hypothetical protein
MNPQNTDDTNSAPPFNPENTPVPEGDVTQQSASKIQQDQTELQDDQNTADANVESQPEVHEAQVVSAEHGVSEAPESATTESVEGDQEVEKGTSDQPQPSPERSEEAVSSTEQNVMPEVGVAASQKPPKKSRKKLAISVVLILLGVLLIAGGAAAAYVRVILPNKPENVLKQAAANTLQEKRITFDGTIDLQSESEDFPATKAEFVSQVDSEKNVSSTVLQLNVSGVDFELDARTIDGNVYVKVGDITTLQALMELSANDEEAAVYDELFRKASEVVSEKWIVFDSTLLKEADVECIANTSIALTDKDLELIVNQFDKYPFITIDNHSDEAVENVDAIKYDLTVDSKKAEGFAKGLENLSVVRSLNKCNDAIGEYDEDLKQGSKPTNDKTKLVVWVHKAEKRLHKIAIEDYSVDDESKTTMDLKSILKYEDFVVDKPENAQPALQIWTELQKVLFGDAVTVNESDLEFATRAEENTAF